MFEWAWPLMGLLLPLPWLLRRLLPAVKNQQHAALRVPFFNELQQLTTQQPSTQTTKFNRSPWLAILIWCCLVLAIMRPQWLGEPVATPLTGRDLLMAVDVSGSMEVPDLTLGGESVDRLTVVKVIGGEFIQQRLGDRVGLILFGSQAYLQTPLTHDRHTVTQMLNEAQIGIAGKATAIGDAIGLAIKRLRDRPDQSRVLILLTDGDNTAGEVDPREAARLAAEDNIKIYTIGLGAESMQVPGFFGSRTVNPSADLDEALLSEIAALTGGRYFRAKESAQLSEIYQLLDQLEPSEGESEYYRPREELYLWPLGLALILSLCFAGYRGRSQ
ncbi:MAG: VWA domain-containing protein [Gammaproteobacteria bacterium]|nr:VWA domain-containing protein [Gammaproteobacteria bacterium]